MSRFIIPTHGGACLLFFVAFEILCWDWGFVFGESVRPTALHTFVRQLIVRVSFFNGGLLFSSITLSTVALVSLYSFLLLVKTKFVVSGSFGGMSLSVVIITLHLLIDFRPGRNALRTMDALLDSHLYHNLTDWLCLRIHDIRRGELAELRLCCFALHIVHPSSISYYHATHHIPSHGAYSKFGEAKHNGSCRRCIHPCWSRLHLRQ